MSFIHKFIGLQHIQLNNGMFSISKLQNKKEKYRLLLLFVVAYVFLVTIFRTSRVQALTKNIQLNDLREFQSSSYGDFENRRRPNDNERFKSEKQSSKLQSNKTDSNRGNIKRKPIVNQIVHPSLHAGWDEYGNICLLAKFQATFTIKYDTESGTKQLIDKMPASVRSKGRCDQFDEKPVLDVLWKNAKIGQTNTTAAFTFRIIFEKYPNEDLWGVEQMQFLYHTGHPLFRGSKSPSSKYIVKSNKNDLRLHFKTHLYESMLCPSPPPIQMYDSQGVPRVIARLTNMQLQAFNFKEKSNFGIFSRCEQVSYGSGVAHPLTPSTIRNDSLTFAIGMMTVSIASLSVVGYAFYRSRALNLVSNYKTVI